MEFVHVDHIHGTHPQVVYYEPLESQPDCSVLTGVICLDDKNIWFCLGLYPNEDEPLYYLTLEYDYDPIVLAEFVPKDNRFVISYNEVPEDHYIIIFYSMFSHNWSKEGF